MASWVVTPDSGKLSVKVTKVRDRAAVARIQLIMNGSFFGSITPPVEVLKPDRAWW